MDKPLTVWYCDYCDDKIEEASLGYLIWKTTGIAAHDFKVLHHGKCSDMFRRHPNSNPLQDFVGDIGLTRLLSMLSLGPINAKRAEGSRERLILSDDEFVDLVRRLHVPYYEEARRKFDEEDLIEEFSNSGEIRPYVPDTLKRIITAEDL